VTWPFERSQRKPKVLTIVYNNKFSPDVAETVVKGCRDVNSLTHKLSQEPNYKTELPKKNLKVLRLLEPLSYLWHEKFRSIVGFFLLDNF